ncbi:hypothetical protein B0F90DRAFT_1696711 [Multifurca ochricompacta]|uniref:Uncharacterized protein n=1 Tax=Multifurca ochricompacta TaxID=376703 RepID=A0AAD4M9S6_9AGAM|nr:hypothetical protein B0F90DRAFT_1696711 [Multifurca ochricompacta]
MACAIVEMCRFCTLVLSSNMSGLSCVEKRIGNRIHSKYVSHLQHQPHVNTMHINWCAITPLYSQSESTDLMYRQEHLLLSQLKRWHIPLNECRCAVLIQVSPQDKVVKEIKSARKENGRDDAFER